jgi:hypothetical protein
MNTDDSKVKDNSLKLKSGIIISIKKQSRLLKEALNDFDLTLRAIHNPDLKQDLSRMIKALREIKRLVSEYNKKSKK